MNEMSTRLARIDYQRHTDELAEIGAEIIRRMESEGATLYELTTTLHCTDIELSIDDIYRLANALDYVVSGAREYWQSGDNKDLVQITDFEIAEKIKAILE